MGNPQIIEKISVEDYLSGEPHAEIKHEYIDGQVYAMAGASERHNRIALNIAIQLRSTSRGTPCGVFMSDMKFKHATFNIVYYPDVMLVCDTSDNDAYVKQRPCLIAEVLSPSTATIDRREKWHTYRNTPSLRYYLLVNPDAPIVEIYSRAQDDGWLRSTLEADDVLSIDCPPINTSLTLHDIYEDVDVIPLT
jgi:Uma2 family endonuclease